MKVLFIYTSDDVTKLNTPIASWSGIQFGISYISSLLKNNKHDTDLLVLGKNMSWKKNIKILKTTLDYFSPDMVCFTAVFSQYHFIQKIATILKEERPNIFLVIGGVHATLNPNQLLDKTFDALCIGEGEYPMLEMCNYFNNKTKLYKTNNIWFRKGKNIIKNNVRPYHENLNLLPFPDRKMWIKWMHPNKIKEDVILLGRGCPFNCTYCCNHALKKITTGKYVRFRSPENIISEIEELNKYNKHLKYIYFEVETIASEKKWLLDFSKKLSAYNKTINNKISYGCNYRVTNIPPDDAFFSALHNANFKNLNIGLESGSEKIRKTVLKRNYTNINFIETINLANKYEFNVTTYNLIGIPGESYNDYLETVNLNRKVLPNNLMPSIFFPYPGTKLYELCLAKNFITEKSLNSNNERNIASIDLPGFSKNKITKERFLFEYRVYKGYKPILPLLIKVYKNKIRMNTLINKGIIIFRNTKLGKKIADKTRR